MRNSRKHDGWRLILATLAVLALPALVLAATAPPVPDYVREDRARFESDASPDKAAEKSLVGDALLLVARGGYVQQWTGYELVNMMYPGTEDLFGVDGVSLDDFWVVGAGGIAHYDGSWGALDDRGVLRDVLVVDDGMVIVGNSGLVERNTGGGWDNLPSGTNQTLLGVWGHSVDDFWVCGGGGVLRHYVNGQSITVSTPGTPTLRGIWGAPGLGPYIVGDGGVILKYANGTVMPETSNTANTLYGIHGTAFDNIWAVGAVGTAMQYDGTDWNSFGIGGTRIFTGVHAAPSELLVVPSDIYMYAYHGPNGGWPAWNGRDDDDNYVNMYFEAVVSVPNTPNLSWWDGFSRPPGGNGLASFGWSGSTYALAVLNNQLTAFGYHDGGLPEGEHEQNLAAFDGTSWTPIGPRATIQPDWRQNIVGYDGKIVVWGYNRDASQWRVWGFDSTDWAALSQINDLSTLGWVYGLTVADVGGSVRLFAYGVFQDGADPNLSLAWEFDANAEAWVTVGTGLPYPFTGESMVEFDGDLYLCGRWYDSAPFGAVYRLDNGDPAGTWTPVLATNHYIWDIVVHNGELYVTTGGVPNIDGLLKYVPGGTPEWQGQQADLSATGGNIYNAVSWGDRLVLGGWFQTLADVPSRNVAFWEDGTVTGLGTGSNSEVTSLTEFNDDLYISGFFSTVGNVESWSIARYDVDVTAPEPPVVALTLPATVTEGVLIPVTASVTSFQRVRSAHLAYRGRDSDEFIHVAMVPGGAANTTWETTIPGTDVPQYGLQYFVTVQTDQAKTSLPADPVDEPGFMGITKSNATWNMPASNRYELFGVPFDGVDKAAMVGALGSYNPANWRMERWNPAAGSGGAYVGFSSLPELAPGQGFYMVHKSAGAVTLSGATTSTAGGVDVTMPPGWTMIATPYDFAINWTAVNRPSDVEDQLVGRSGGVYVYDQTQLVPWSGYFVYNSGTSDVVLNIPPEPAKKSAAVAKGVNSSDLDWSIDIAAHQGERTDLAKTVGAVHPGREGPGNLHQPPYLEHDLVLWTEREMDGKIHRLRRDLREVEEGAVWDLVLRPADGAGTVTLEFDGVSSVAPHLGVTLVTADGTQDLKTEGGNWTGRVDGETRMRLVVGDPEMVEEASRTLPRPFALLPNYPNPFNPQTKVVFTMPRAGQVTVQVYNVAGRLVRTLVDEVRPEGLNEVTWDGRDDGGRGVASGVYFSRMQADGFGQTNKMMLVR